MKDFTYNIAETLARAVGYDKTHVTRTVAYRELDAFVDTLPVEQMAAIKIAAGWK